MKTLTDLFTLISNETELNKGKVVEYLFDIDTKFNWVSMFMRSTILNPKTNEDEMTEKTIISHLSFKKQSELQQAYWTIFNNGRSGR